MMKNLLFLLFFLPKLLQSQQNNIGIDFSNSENLIFLKSINERNDFFNVGNMVRNKPGTIKYRFWNTNYCIEVSRDQNDLKGRVIMAIKDADSENTFFRKSFELTTEQVSRIFTMIDQYQLLSLPTGSKIKGWQQGFDGNTIDIESNINDNYTYKAYWTPSVQNIPEASLIVDIINVLNKIISLEELMVKFTAENKFTCYKYYGTAYTVCKILTKKAQRKLKKEKTVN